MVYKIVSNYLKEDNSLWEISIMKYNINHQEFVIYVKEREKGEIEKKVFPAGEMK